MEWGHRWRCPSGSGQFEFMDIVCFGQQNWDHCWTGKQQLMSRLAARGHRVLYVDPTWLGVGPESSEGTPGLRREGPKDLFVLAYDYRPFLRWKGNVWRWPRTIRGRVEELGFVDPVAIALRPPALPLLRKLAPRGALYYAVDEMTAFGERSPAEMRQVRRDEEAMLLHVDIALGVSERLQERFATLHPRSRWLPNGADLDHFAPARLAAAAPHAGLAALPEAPRPTLVFVGQVDERLDQSLLLRIARERDVRVVLAGRVKDGVDVSAMESEARIHLLGYVPYEDLPGVLREADVCLVPYRVTELTRSCNPLKVFEYLATGRPVVATDLDGLAWCADAIDIAEGPDEFLASLDRRLADPDAGREARLERARANGWDARVDELEDLLAESILLARRREAALRARPDQRYADAAIGARALPFYIATRVLGRLLHLGRLVAVLASRARPGVRRVLVSRRTRLGDLVVLLPMLDALRAHYPSARIDLAVQAGAGPMTRSLLAGRQVVDRIVELDFMAAATLRERASGALRLALEGYDLHVSGAAYSIMREAIFSGAPQRIGLDERHPLQRLNRIRVPHRPDRHEADNHLALAEALGAVALGPARVPWIQPPEADAVRSARVEADVPERARYLVIHPGAQKPSRRWPAERWPELIGRLLDRHDDLHVVLTGSSDESSAIDAVIAALPLPHREHCRSVAGRTDLATLQALMHGASEVVVGDTGVLHLARAVGAPMLALLGPENAARWGPHPGGAGTAMSLRHVVPCAPCKKWDCEPHYCLRALTVEEGLAAVERVLREDGAGVEYPDWASGHGRGLPDASSHERGAPRRLRGARHDHRDQPWADLHALAAAGGDIPDIPVVYVVGDAAASPADVRSRAGWLGYPAQRLRDGWPGDGERPAASSSAAETTLTMVAVLGDTAEWEPGRLGADVARLVRRPDLAVVADPVRGPGAGALLRAAVAEEIRRGRSESDHVGSEEYGRARQVMERLGVGAGSGRLRAGLS